ncbi:MAG: hypothetical protein DI598_10805 [Pseudopedobacter saltans]|uniref:Uncharacterized protein n=1 Tax=Pseudopedobacter saltans TaxID=151895 RepID=A0A2W5EUJ5_9SPHI|nr:MAG: hypothetical protein DI598_10805 [Pseudopedobacter saltans]
MKRKRGGYLLDKSLDYPKRSASKCGKPTGVILALDHGFQRRTEAKYLPSPDPKLLDLSPKHQVKDGKDLNDLRKSE